MFHNRDSHFHLVTNRWPCRSAARHPSQGWGL